MMNAGRKRWDGPPGTTKIAKQSRQPVENTIEVSLNGQSNPKSGITHARLMTDGSPSGGSCANLIDHPIQSAIEESLSCKNKPTKLLKKLESVAKRDKTIPNSDSSLIGFRVDSTVGTAI
jgi:hypothetical protein